MQAGSYNYWPTKKERQTKQDMDCPRQYFLQFKRMQGNVYHLFIYFINVHICSFILLLTRTRNGNIMRKVKNIIGIFIETGDAGCILGTSSKIPFPFSNWIKSAAQYSFSLSYSQFTIPQDVLHFCLCSEANSRTSQKSQITQPTKQYRTGNPSWSRLVIYGLKNKNDFTHG